MEANASPGLNVGADFTIVHVEDEAASWRDNPAIVRALITDIVEDMGEEEADLEELTPKFSDTGVSVISWKQGSANRKAKFVYVVQESVDHVADILEGKCTFVVDAMRPGHDIDAGLGLSLYKTLESISRLKIIEDSAEDIRVFTAFVHVEQEMQLTKKRIRGITFPLRVIRKSQFRDLHAYILKRLGF